MSPLFFNPGNPPEAGEICFHLLERDRADVTVEKKSVVAAMGSVKSNMKK